MFGHKTLLANIEAKRTHKTPKKIVFQICFFGFLWHPFSASTHSKSLYPIRTYIQHSLINIPNVEKYLFLLCIMSCCVLFHGDMYLNNLPETIDGEYDVDNKKEGEARH